MLYLMEMGRLDSHDSSRCYGLIGEPDAVSIDDEARTYADALAGGAWHGRERIDGYIGAAAKNWRLERLSIVDRLLMRLAVHELLDQPSTPPRVVMDEAIELARRYSGEEAARFVNGVLDGVLQTLRAEGYVRVE